MTSPLQQQAQADPASPGHPTRGTSPGPRRWDSYGIEPSMNRRLTVIHEDADLLVINKPADLVCHPTKGDAWSSLIGRVRLYLGPNVKPHFANRLDRETSGVVVLAKTLEVARSLRRLWETRTVQKEYLAIVHGHPREAKGVIDAPIGKDEESRVAIKERVSPEGASAQTDYRVEKLFNRPQGQFALVRLFPLTGRKHQLRVHLAHIGHPIVGDKLYGGDEEAYLAFVENRLALQQRQRLILPWQALHAQVIRFAWKGRPIEFKADPEEWFMRFVEERHCEDVRITPTPSGSVCCTARVPESCFHLVVD